MYHFFFGLLVVGGLLFAVKKLMSVLQLIGSAMTIAERDVQTPQSDSKKNEWGIELSDFYRIGM
jgi:hypothetical protein